MPEATTPSPPDRIYPSDDTASTALVDRVRECLEALPAHFSSETHIEGLESGDLFALNNVLGGTIEIQVVETLNRLRAIWDPEEDWLQYRFVRRAQSFPDVRLAVGEADRPDKVAMGIELKGWYLLAKEGEPSFRYTATPAACSPYDLLVVVPWHLKNVLSGAPIVYTPFIEQARYAAEYRNHWWEHVREAKGSTEIRLPEGDHVHPYPPPKVQIKDTPVSDAGRNFGRVARVTGLMDSFTEQRRSIDVAGIEARHWIAFFQAHAEARDPEELSRRLHRLLGQPTVALGEKESARVAELIDELSELLDSAD